MSPELKRDLMDIAWATRAKRPEFPNEHWTQALDPCVACPAEAIPDKVIEELIHAVVSEHYQDDGDAELFAELGRWIVNLFGSSHAAQWAMPVGVAIHDELHWVSRPEKRREIWRIIHDAIEAALDDDETLRDLACCWFEHFVDDGFDVRQLFEFGMSPEMAEAIGTHTGYMSSEQQAELHKRLRSAPRS